MSGTVNNRWFVNGLALVGAGLLASSASSFLAIFALLGTATKFTRGFFDGVAVVASCAAI
jgi:hypothetical protein